MEIHSMDAFLAYFENIRNRTRRVIACIPPDQLEWTPTEGKFTFGDLIRHLAATERYMFAENVQGRPSGIRATDVSWRTDTRRSSGILRGCMRKRSKSSEKWGIRASRPESPPLPAYR